MENLKSLLRSEGDSLTRFERPLPFPVDPNFLIATVDADSATLFKVSRRSGSNSSSTSLSPRKEVVILRGESEECSRMLYFRNRSCGKMVLT